jgi:hypothetical protein
MHAGRECLVPCAAVLVAGAVLALADARLPPLVLSGFQRRIVGIAVAVVIVAGGAVGASAATHGRPFHFVAQEWNGFAHQEAYSTSGSNFAAVGSGRYDFWRVGLDAFLAHPIGGLGQDNFLAYYLHHRRTSEQPQWTHSLEMRLLVHTGLVGFALFVTFLIAALTAAVGAARRAGPLGRAVAGAALLPVIVWTIHGSVDWFWEFPALSGPALGFLGMATALARPSTSGAPARERTRARAAWIRMPIPTIGTRIGAIRERIPTLVTRVPTIALRVGGVVAVGVAAVTLGVPYLADAEVSRANTIAVSDPVGALREYARAAKLNPLSSGPGFDGGLLALEIGRYADAERRFRQAITRDPDALWEAWLGEGLAASALGDRAQARRDYLSSRLINPLQPVTKQALARLRSHSPLAPKEALNELQNQD